MAERLGIPPWDIWKIPAAWYQRIVTALNAEADAREMLAERNSQKSKQARD